MDILIRLDEKGFVYYDGIKMPFKFLPETQEIEVKIKHKKHAQEYGAEKVCINLIDLQVLSLLYPVGGDHLNKWKCENCNKHGVSNFKGTTIDTIGQPVILFECLHCGHTFAPMKPK